MDLIDVNSSYLNKLLANISKEQNSIFQLGDFNVNLLNSNEHNLTNKILQPTRRTSHSNTLIDNVFSKVTDPDIMSSNLIATIYNHLPRFAVIPNMPGNTTINKYNIYEQDWCKFD